VYTLELYSNGANSASQSVALTGTVPNNDVFVIAHGSAGSSILAQADQTSNAVINFNGDDAVVLKKNGVVIDSIGQVGVDPGTEWGTGLISTQDNTLRRKPSIFSGDTNPNDTFDPSVEWDGYAQDTFDGLGSHTINSCGGVS
jgi:predicted extracellular nuclease